MACSSGIQGNEQYGLHGGGFMLNLNVAEFKWEMSQLHIVCSVDGLEVM